MSLSHIKNSKAGRENYEVSTNDLFKVTFILPSSIGQEPLLTEHVISCTGIKYPSAETIQQQHLQARRNFASNDVDATQNVELTLSLNINHQKQNYIWKKLKQWKNLTYNPNIGMGVLKKDYIGTIIVEKLNRVGDVIEKITLHNTFPITETSGLWDFDITSPDPIQLPFPIIADYAEFDDV